MKKYHACSHAHGRQSWDGSIGVTKLQQHPPPYIGQHLLNSTYTFHIASVFGGYVRHVMSALLPKLFKLMSNENRVRLYYEMHSFMKPNVPVIMPHEHQSLAAI